MNELPNPDLVVFKNVLRKNKIESDIGDMIVANQNSSIVASL